jgi:hypothetical protein
LSELLAVAGSYHDYAAPARRQQRQLGWVIELAHLLRVPEDAGQARTARQVKRELKAFLHDLAQATATDPGDVPVAQHLIQTVRNRWWGLFPCYRIPGLPATNNAHELFFNQLKHAQRRITGRKSVHEFVMRYGVYAAYLDPREAFEELLARLRQVSDAEFQATRQAWRENEAPLHKTYRFRHHQACFLKELEVEWAKIVEEYPLRGER